MSDVLFVLKNAVESKFEKNKIISELQLKVSNTWIGSLQAIIGLLVQNKNTFPSPAYLVQFWGKAFMLINWEQLFLESL